MRRPIAWFIGLCAAWWLLCMSFPLGAYLIAGAVLSVTDGQSELRQLLFVPLGLAAVGAIPICLAFQRLRNPWSFLVAWFAVAILLAVFWSGIATGYIAWLCRSAM